MIKENQVKITASKLFRLSGLSAMLAGLCFLIIGLFHPENQPAFVTTPTWVIVHIFATSLGFLGLFALAGLYAVQVEKARWLGLIGFLLFSGWMALQMPFSFLEAAVLPQLASTYPPFVAGLLGMFTGVPSQVNLGVLPTLWNISTPMLILGDLLFAIATFRANILPRWAAGLLALGCLMIPVGALVPTELQAKIILVPIGLGVAWMGYALFSNRQESRQESTQAYPARQMSPIPQTGAEEDHLK